MTTHLMLSAFDKETACGRKYKGLEITVFPAKCDCKSCKNRYNLETMKKEVERGSTTVQRED